MNSRDKETRIIELPEGIRRLIEREIEEGLSRVRRPEFESRLRARLKAAGAAPAPGRLARRFWIPALAAAGAAALLLVAWLWIGRPGAAGSGTAAEALGSALERMPGVRNLETGLGPGTFAEEAASKSAGVIWLALGSASRGASTAPPPPGPSPESLRPRYDLEQKMEILFGQRTIERALSYYKDKFREV
jgi:hypothetical protein